MKRSASLARRFASDDRGLETIEYAVMTAMIVAGIVMALVTLAGAMDGRFAATQGTIDGI